VKKNNTEIYYESVGSWDIWQSKIYQKAEI